MPDANGDPTLAELMGISQGFAQLNKQAKDDVLTEAQLEQAKVSKAAAEFNLSAAKEKQPLEVEGLRLNVDNAKREASQAAIVDPLNVKRLRNTITFEEEQAARNKVKHVADLALSSTTLALQKGEIRKQQFALDAAASEKQRQSQILRLQKIQSALEVGDTATADQMIVEGMNREPGVRGTTKIDVIDGQKVLVSGRPGETPTVQPLDYKQVIASGTALVADPIEYGKYRQQQAQANRIENYSAILQAPTFYNKATGQTAVYVEGSDPHSSQAKPPVIMNVDTQQRYSSVDDLLQSGFVPLAQTAATQAAQTAQPEANKATLQTKNDAIAAELAPVKDTLLAMEDGPEKKAAVANYEAKLQQIKDNEASMGEQLTPQEMSTLATALKSEWQKMAESGGQAEYGNDYAKFLEKEGPMAAQGYMASKAGQSWSARLALTPPAAPAPGATDPSLDPTNPAYHILRAKEAKKAGVPDPASPPPPQNPGAATRAATQPSPAATQPPSGGWLPVDPDRPGGFFAGLGYDLGKAASRPPYDFNAEVERANDATRQSNKKLHKTVADAFKNARKGYSQGRTQQ